MCSAFEGEARALYRNGERLPFIKTSLFDIILLMFSALRYDLREYFHGNNSKFAIFKQIMQIFAFIAGFPGRCF